jgi:hypothetical protein
MQFMGYVVMEHRQQMLEYIGLMRTEQLLVTVMLTGVLAKGAF